MSRYLPPFAWLQAFEATARHLSFTRAATELNLTQTAVSHRIRKLEELLGLRLFVRDGNTVTLTEVAHDFLASTRTAISEVLSATDRAVNHQRGDLLTIACPGTFAIKCLIPLLPRFRAQYPDIHLRIRTLLPSRHQPLPDYDLSIQYGVGDWPGRVSERICQDEIFPVCSPALTRRPHRLRTPADLADHTIIRPVSPLIVQDEWPEWLEEAGYSDVTFGGEISCDLLYPSFQAAIEGLGVVMGRGTVVKRDIEAGLLVEPFKTRLRSHSSYYLLFSDPSDREKRSMQRTFRDWLLHEMNR